MKRLGLLLALGAVACGQDAPEDSNPAPTAAAPDLSKIDPTPANRPPEVLPLPKEQAQLDRMILAGYTPHAGHLHPPGVNSCPLTKGKEAVM